MTIHKCDRCGKIIENFDSINSDRHYKILAEIDDIPFDISESSIDLCEDCYKQFLSWMQGINLVSDTKITAAESVGFRQGYKMAENKIKSGRPGVA